MDGPWGGHASTIAQRESQPLPTDLKEVRESSRWIRVNTRVAHLSLKLLIDRDGVRSESQGWLMSSVDRTIDVRPRPSQYHVCVQELTIRAPY